jgi:hypothetical protein
MYDNVQINGVKINSLRNKINFVLCHKFSSLLCRLLIVLHVLLLLHGLLLPLLLRDGRRPLLRLPPPVQVVVERRVKHETQDPGTVGHGQLNLPFLLDQLVNLHPLKNEFYRHQNT